MTAMTHPAALQTFVDDELMRAPLLIEQTIEAVQEGLRITMPTLSPAERTMAADLLQALVGKRPRVVAEYLRSLRAQVQTPAGLTTAPRAAAATMPAQSLSLVGETEVAVDVVLSQAVEAIKSVAEAELRELQTYTSALVGDMAVAGEHNPFRPETQARALWTAAQGLTPSLGFQVSFMRHAGMPFAKVLRKSYAAACARLESCGIEPAAYRTLILPAGARSERPTHDTDFQPDLQRIRETMPVPLDMPAGSATEFDKVLRQADEQLRGVPVDTGRTQFGRLRETQRVRLVETAATPVDQQLIELLSRLFDAIVADRHLPPDVQLLLSRLQASALRVALRDPTTLDDYGHPVWLFMDRLAFVAETLAPPGDAERDRLMRHAQGVVEHVIGETTHDAQLYRWATGRLKAYERNRFERRAEAAADEVGELQLLDTRLAMAETPTSSFNGTLDVQQLDTVPADLLDAAPPNNRPTDSQSTTWLAERDAGDWLRVFLQGDWVNAQLLWKGEHGQLWLLADGSSRRTWAVRRRALGALHEARLLDTLAQRSLLRSAARKVLRRMEAG